MKTETIELDDRFGKEYVGKYVFQEVTWAKRSHLIQKNTRYHPVTGHVISSDYVQIQAETIWASLKEQPQNKPVTLEKLCSEDDGIPIGLGELFSRVVNRLCGLTVDQANFLSEPSEEADLTQTLPLLGSAKSSESCQVKSEENRRGT